MMSVLQLNFSRIRNERSTLVLTFLMLAGAVFAAMFISAKSDFSANLALITPTGRSVMSSSENIKIIMLKQRPPMSDLLLGKYDAFVTVKGDGRYNVETVRDRRFKQTLTAFLEGNTASQAASQAKRGPGTSIFGFMMMFLLMQGVSLMFPYATDKEHKGLVRVAATPLPLWRYLCTQSLTTFTLLYVPSLTVVGLMMAVTNYDTGFNTIQYAWLLAIFCMFATSLGLVLHSFAKDRDTGNMMGSWVTIFTTILAGGFHSTMDQTGFMGWLTEKIPQHAFLSFAQALEKGDIGSQTSHILYPVICSLAFFAISTVKINREYVAKRR